MNDTPFQQRLRAAIEARQSLEGLGEALELDPSDEREWRRQIRLDRAIAAWKRGDATEPARAVRGRRHRGWALSVAALGLGIVGLGLDFGTGGGSAETQLAHSAPAAVEVQTSMAVQPVRAVKPAPIAVAHFAPVAELELDPPLSPARQRATFNETADRLVYAFEPVGQRVSAVMNRLIDAVPGAEALATGWQYGS